MLDPPNHYPRVDALKLWFGVEGTRPPSTPVATPTTHPLTSTSRRKMLLYLYTTSIIIYQYPFVFLGFPPASLYMCTPVDVPRGSVVIAGAVSLLFMASSCGVLEI